MNDGILLATINAKWIHPSLALRLLKANLGPPLEKNCAIIEFALRQPLWEKIEPIIAAQPRILVISVSIWNHIATLELLKALHLMWQDDSRPTIVLGGPEVSYLSQEAEIFRYADYCVVGEGEIAFRRLCETIFENGGFVSASRRLRFTCAAIPPHENGEKNSTTVFINKDFQQVDVTAIKSAYHLYTDEDLRKKLVYVEASRGCPFGCEFCLSGNEKDRKVREFPLEPFLAEMDDLIQRGAQTFKFLDRTFNLNIERAQRIMKFFLEHIAGQVQPIVVHFEMVPSRFPPELIETLARFPPDTLRLEIGIQTLNLDVSARIGRPSNPVQELETLRLLREQTNAIIHADLIAGLPGEDLASFGRGFDALWMGLNSQKDLTQRHKGAKENAEYPNFVQDFMEIQLGILKLLPGAPIARHTQAFGMCYNPLPPYEIVDSAAIGGGPRDLDRIKNFARFWELIVNRGLLPVARIGSSAVFERFMALSDALLARFGRNWGIDKRELKEAVDELYK